MPALVVGLYLHPDNDVTNQQVKDSVVRTIEKFLESNRDRQVFLMVAGDFNHNMR